MTSTRLYRGVFPVAPTIFDDRGNVSLSLTFFFCAYRKSHPAVLMVQSTRHRATSKCIAEGAQDSCRARGLRVVG